MTAADDKPLVDVGIPTYGEPKFLAQAIETVLDQTLSAWTLTISENGPGSAVVAAAVKPYLADPRVRYVSTGTNLGGARNSSRLIQSGSAPYVALLHDDDLWAPQFLERRVAFLDANPSCGLVFSVADFIDNLGSVIHRFRVRLPTGLQERRRLLRALYAHNFIGFLTALVPRRCYEAVGPGFNDKLVFYDYEMWLRLASRFDVGYLGVVDSYYRIHPGQTTYDIDGTVGEHRIALIDAADEILPADFPLLDRRRARSGAFLRIAVDAMGRGDRRRSLAHIKKALQQYPIALLDPRMAALAFVSIWRHTLLRRAWRSPGLGGSLATVVSEPAQNAAPRYSAASLPRISVALGTYNGERFLREQLGSLASQTVLPAELVASDDCSSDSTLAILERFAREAPFPVRILRHASNAGFTANMIRAAEQCQGPLIAFCDQDDVWSKDKIELCARFFADNRIRLLLHSATPVDENLRPIGKPYPSVRRTFVAPRLGADPWLVAPGFALVMDKALLGLADWRSRPPSRDLDGRQMDFDEWFYFLAWSTADIGFLGRSLVLYRQHGRNVVGSPDVTWRNRLRKLLVADFATHRGRAYVARSYAEFLEEMSQAASDVELRQRSSAGARRWRAYEELSKQRDGFYAAGSSIERLRRLWRLAVSRSYRSRESGGLGRLAFARDLRELALPSRASNLAPARPS